MNGFVVCIAWTFYFDAKERHAVKFYKAWMGNEFEESGAA